MNIKKNRSCMYESQSQSQSPSWFLPMLVPDVRLTVCSCSCSCLGSCLPRACFCSPTFPHLHLQPLTPSPSPSHIFRCISSYPPSTLLLALRRRRHPRLGTPTKHHAFEAHPTPQQQKARRSPCHPKKLLARAGGHIGPKAVRVDQRDEFECEDCRDD